MEQEVAFKTLIRLLFNTSSDFEVAGITLAFRDLSRTLPVKNKDQKERKRLKENIVKILKADLHELIKKDIKSQAEFDKIHEGLCKKLRSEWNELSIGHCQKWINMTLKYWLVLGNERIPSVSQNYCYFHVPLDSY